MTQLDKTDVAAPTTAATKLEAPPGAGRLARAGIPFVGSLAQSVGLIGASAGAGIITIPVYEVAGPFGWLTWLIGAAAVLCVGGAIVILARRFLTTGGLYPLAGKAGGRIFGFFTMYGSLLWIIVGAPSLCIFTGLYVTDFLELPAIGLHPSTSVIFIVGFCSAFVAAYVAYSGIKISIAALLGLEFLTLTLIVVLLVVTVVTHHGGPIDHKQFHFSALHSSVLLNGLVLVVFAFGGFESATVLGQEAGGARRNIPLAVISSLVLIGLFDAFLQYGTVLAFAGTNHPLIDSTNPLGDAAKFAGIGWYQYIITACLALAALANSIALFNAGARMLFTLPRESGVGRWLLRTSRRHLTPTSGILVFLVADVATMVGFGIAKADPIALFGNLGTLSGYGAVVMYVVTCLATITFLVRRGMWNVLGFAVCVAGGGTMSYGLYKSLNPFPSYPTSVYAWIFVGSAAAAVVAYLALWRRGWGVFKGMSVDEDSPLAETERA